MKFVVTAVDGKMKGKTWTFENEPIWLGRDFSSGIVLEESHISRRHAKLWQDGKTKELFLEDAESTHGTYVFNGAFWKKIPPFQSFQIENGTLLRLSPKGPSFTITSVPGEETGKIGPIQVPFVKNQEDSIRNPAQGQTQLQVRGQSEDAEQSHMAKAGAEDLLAEFSQLISQISLEVTQQATFSTALKEMKQVNENLSALQKSLPKTVKEVEETGAVFGQIKNEAGKILQTSAENIERHEQMLKQQLTLVTSRYQQMGDSLLDNQQKALIGQTREIQRNTDETIEQVHTAIVESQKKLGMQIEKLAFMLDNLREQTIETKAESVQKVDFLEAHLIQLANFNMNQQLRDTETKYRRLLGLSIANMALVLLLSTGYWMLLAK